MEKYPLGFSTSWNAAGIDDGARIVRQITDLGFRCIEVEYRVSEYAVAGFREAVDSGTISVLSVHNYTPLAGGEKATSRGGDKLNLASPDEAERKEAVRLTLRSLDLGVSLGAKALVVHLGETDMTRDYFRDLVDSVGKEGVASRRAADLRKQVTQARHSRKGPYLDAALRSLNDLLPHAEEAEIVLGIENRYYYHQIPLPDEIPDLLDRMGSPFVRYWHDIGHAHVMEALGFMKHDDILDPLVDRLFGVHIHDAVFIRDHRAPGTGEIPLDEALRRIPEDAVKIVEVSSGVPQGDIVRSAPLLEALGLRRAGPADT
jgi:sugar phosphate isomerase/epimerase